MTVLRQDFYEEINADDVVRRIDKRSVGPVLDASVPGAVAGFVTQAASFAMLKRSVLTFDDLAITMTDATTAGCHGGAAVLAFPAGLITVIGVYGDITITAGAGGIADTAAVVAAVGSVVTATDNATLLTTEANFVPSTAFTLSGGVKNGKLFSTTVLELGTFAAPLSAFLNFAVPDAGSTANDTLTVAGTLGFVWAWGGPDGS